MYCTKHTYMYIFLAVKVTFSSALKTRLSLPLKQMYRHVEKTHQEICSSDIESATYKS